MANFEQGDNFGGSANTSSTAAAEKMGAEVYAPEGEELQFDPNKVPSRDGGSKTELHPFDEENEEFQDEMPLPQEEKGELKDLDGSKGPINEGKAEEAESSGDVQIEQKKMIPDEYDNNSGEGTDKMRLLKKEEQAAADERLRKKMQATYCETPGGTPKAKFTNDSIVFESI